MAAMEQEKKELERREKWLQKLQQFRRNAFEIIGYMLVWHKDTTGSKQLVDEILHSIFFLGEIMTKESTIGKTIPEYIISDDEMLMKLKTNYPGPFECYKSQLPQRSPFSCVLDMIVLQSRQNQESEQSQFGQIVQRLQEIVDSLEDGFLVSTTLCVSTCKTSKDNYYGVSMSTTGPNADKIMIAASCLSSWEEYVSGAVMTYYPEKHDQKTKQKKSYFDGTFQLPDTVTYEVFNIMEQTYLVPCRSCWNLFGLGTYVRKQCPYGQCAEVESVSKLLINEKCVKGASKLKSPTFTAEARAKAEESVRGVLRQELNAVGFNWDGNSFYQPQG